MFTWPNLSGWSWVGLGVILVLAAWGWSFGLWRKFKREYEYEDVFKFTLCVELCALVGVLTGTWLGSSWSGFVAGLTGGLVAGHHLTEVDLWEVADWAFLAGIAVVWPALAIVGDIYHLLGVGIIFMTGIITAIYYRRWGWYRSGKPGLAYLQALFFLSVLEIPVAISGKWGLYLLIALGAGASAGFIYLRSANRLTVLWQKNSRRKKKSISQP